MRTIYLSIIVVLVFSTLLYIKPVQADNENGVVIQNIQTLPTAIIIGHTFKINATLINNSTTQIFVEHGACGSPFSVTFDNHVVVRTNNVTCTLQLIEQRLDPGTKITSSSPNLDLTYVAEENGTVNATVSFPYDVWNQTSQSNTKENISKPFSFVIYPKARVPTLSIHDNQAIIDVALAIPDLQKWSNDWQYVSMGFMTAKNQPGNWQYATVNLKASSDSSLVPCKNGWDAMVTIDRTTMKVISAWYPTMESHNCDNYTTGGGPQSHGSFITKINTPLKQFKSGVAAKDVTCKENLELILKTKDNSPICVKSDTAMTLIKRSWAMSSLKNFGYNPGRGPVSLEPKESGTHDNTLLPKNTQHMVIPPLNDTNSAKLKATNENKNSSPLQLFLSIDSEYENPGGPVSIDVGLNNTGSVPLTLAKSDNWPRNDMSSGLCSYLPFGISILKGYYTEQNMSSAKSLVIYENVPCPAPSLIKSYTFEPSSSKATQECDSLFTCPGLTDMKAHLVIPDFMYNGQHHSFDVGKYTVVGGDEWGHVAIQHFTEEYATAYSNSLGK